ALADRLVEQDYPADERLDARRREQQVPVCPTARLGRLDADQAEALLDRRLRLIGGKDPLARHDEGAGRGFRSSTSCAIITVPPCLCRRRRVPSTRKPLVAWTLSFDPPSPAVRRSSACDRRASYASACCPGV